MGKKGNNHMREKEKTNIIEQLKQNGNCPFRPYERKIGELKRMLKG